MTVDIALVEKSYLVDGLKNGTKSAIKRTGVRQVETPAQVNIRI